MPETLAFEIHTQFQIPGRLVYLAGRDRKLDLEESLAGAGYRVEPVEVYAAQPAEFLSDAALSLVETGKIGAGLHYSRRSTEIYLGLARKAGLDLSRVNHVCISHDAAAPLLDADIHGVLIAKTPDEPAMFAIVNGLAGLPDVPLE